MKLNSQIKILVACDGGAASGKTTAAKLLSKKFNLSFLSSGLLYRYISYKLISKKKILSKNDYIKKISKNISLKKLKNKKLFREDVTKYASAGLGTFPFPKCGNLVLKKLKFPDYLN